MELICIAKIHTDIRDKFGLPRQSGRVPQLMGRIVFEPEYRNPDYIRGIEQYDQIWVIWGFDQLDDEHNNNPTVRPPKLGGNMRVGVFATRSPFRPNSIGLSSLKIESVNMDGPDGPEIIVSGIDMADGTPLYDIKPYIPYADSHPDAKGGFSSEHAGDKLDVICETDLPKELSPVQKDALLGLLADDPRPAYQDDPGRIYGLSYAGYNIRFKVSDNTLTVFSIEKDEA